MRTRYVDRRSLIKHEMREIDDIILVADQSQDLAARDYLTRMAVIRLSGYLETCMEHMVNGFLEENSSHRVLAFGRSQAARIQNLNPSKLEALIGNFDSEWRDVINEFLAEDERRQTLGNLIDARHKLAHGKTSSVLPSTLARYHHLAEQLVDLLASLFLPVNGQDHA